MAEKDTRSNKEKLESAGDIAGKTAELLLDRGCEVFRSMSFLINGSPALSNGLICFAMADAVAYNELMNCGSAKEINRLAMDEELLASAEPSQVLELVRKLQILIFSIADEVSRVTTGKMKTYLMPPKADPGDPYSDLELDFGPEVDVPEVKPVDEKNQNNKEKK